MKIEKVKNLPPFGRFVYWIRERHKVYLKKEVGQEKPWTDDEILQTQFFTNPFRENDRVTKWFSEYIREPLEDTPDQLFASVVFRWFNKPETGHALIDNDLVYINYWNWERAVEVLDELDKPFSGAYIISPAGSTKPKTQRICQDFIDVVHVDFWNLWERLYEQELTLENLWKELHQYPGLGGGGFMAYEIVCDMQHTKMYSEAPDTCTWTNLGPGAKRGINRVLGNPIKHPLGGRKACLDKARIIYDKTVSFFTKYEPNLVDSIDMRTIEHSLCEFDKYERVLWRQGRSKRRYDAT